MKVYINKYKDHWISPYTMLDYIFFWKDWSKCSRTWKLEDSLNDDIEVTKGGKSRYIERPDWVDKWSDRLSPISVAIQWIWDKIDRKIDYVKIDRWDTWSMDHTLSYIILPMLKQLQATKHGSCLVDDSDVPEELKSTSAPPKENEWDSDANTHKRWDWVMDELIWTFEQLQPDYDWEEQYRSGVADFIFVPVDAEGNEVPKGKNTFSEMRHGPKHTLEMDWEGRKAHQERINNGLRLFGRYYQGLWD